MALLPANKLTSGNLELLELLPNERQELGRESSLRN